MNKRRGLWLVLAALFVTAVTVFYVRTRVGVMRMNMELAERLNRQRELDRENKRLRIAVEKRMTPARLERAVSKNLELAAPAESQVMLIEEEMAQ